MTKTTTSSINTGTPVKASGSNKFGFKNNVKASCFSNVSTPLSKSSTPSKKQAVTNIIINVVTDSLNLAIGKI